MNDQISTGDGVSGGVELPGSAAQRDGASSSTNGTDRFIAILNRLTVEYPETPSMLHYTTPFELLIGVILSAQTTDEQVNAILPDLFGRYPDAKALSVARHEEVESIIHSVGFFRQKTKSIIATARTLVADHGGEVPRTMEELVKLKGVGRKSAGVILLHIYDRPAIIVDTHFGRVVRRLGFSDTKDPVRLEGDVAAVLPEPFWNSASMRLNYHGRRYCHARKPDCGICPVQALCPSGGGNDDVTALDVTALDVTTPDVNALDATGRDSGST